MKNTIIIILALAVLGGTAYFLLKTQSNTEPVNDEQTTPTTPTVGTTTDENSMSNGEQTGENEGSEFTTVIGTSVEGREIIAHHYGSGDKELLFVGGIHGGYSWNTALVAYELMDYLEANEAVIPDGVKVTVIPVLNPDGLESVVGTDGRFSRADVPTSLDRTVPGRFNAHNVDLNRNFDCDWKSEGTWQKRKVSGGDTAFSEPESQAIRDYVDENDITAAVVWYSAVGGVFASNCHNGILPETKTIMNLYSKASGYEAYDDFDFYVITGDMVNWLALQEIPAISVLLTTHQDVEWDKNKKGIEALFEHYKN